jgi:hypothetical protein
MRTSFDPAHPRGATLGAGAPNATGSAPSKPTDRELRQTAETRLASFIVHDAPGDFGPCDGLSNPVLFRTQPGDASPIDLSDVRQDLNEDCFVLAPLGALTRTEAGRTLIQNMVAENRNASGEVVSYTVTLHRPEQPHTEVKVTVDAQFECGHARARRDGDSSEVWPLVIEAAYAKFTGGYRSIQRGFASVAMTILTGKSPEIFSPHRYDAQQLKTDLARGKIVVFDTAPIGRVSCQFPPGSSAPLQAGAYNLFTRHSYAAIGTEERNGKQYVVLHNPWNTDEPDAIPFDELGAWFDAIHVGSVP